MVQIKNLKVYGLEESILRSGLPMRTKEPIERKLDFKDYRRARNLGNVKSGTGHDNFLKGIIVQFDLKYPQYFTPQLQRYSWVDIVSSQSKMHCLTKGEFEYNKYVTPEIYEEFETYINEYNDFKENKIGEPYELFMKCISNCPMGLEMWMGITTNYLQLKTIYKQRKNHKLEEDWGEFCSMIKQLPQSYLITGDKNAL